jgi:DNA-binding GntR family transcriptional regulator
VKYIPTDRPNTLYEEHHRIIEEIKNRNPQAAEKAAQQHIERAFQIHLETSFQDRTKK